MTKVNYTASILPIFGVSSILMLVVGSLMGYVVYGGFSGLIGVGFGMILLIISTVIGLIPFVGALLYYYWLAPFVSNVIQDFVPVIAEDPKFFNFMSGIVGIDAILLTVITSVVSVILILALIFSRD